jgi:tRNA A37 threonylcarbamoyladenosine synthetase subunit TsaC/SUA5/YrdC
VPKSPICEALVRALGRPLLTTSAIPPGADAACLDLDEAKAAWPSGVDLFIDGGPTPAEPSTIVSLIGDEIEVLREGLGPIEGVLI